MKIEARSIDRFLANPGEVRAVLLHGEDEGLVRLRAEILTKAVAGSKDDPFRVAWLSREEHDRLPEEASAIAMIPGRRVIRVRDATDSLTAAVKRAVDAPGDSLIVLEAGALSSKSKLRTLCDAERLTAIIPCYTDGVGAIQQTIVTGLKSSGITIDEDAKLWLSTHLGADRASTLNEVEKLILYAGPALALTLDDVQSCVGEQSAVSLDDAIYAVMTGDTKLADRSIDLAFEAGTSSVAVCRAMLSHMGRMQGAAANIASGLSASDAVKQLRPPVFFARAAAFSQSLPLWPSARIRNALEAIRRTELACKQSHAPDELLVRRLVAGLARQAAQGR